MCTKGLSGYLIWLAVPRRVVHRQPARSTASLTARPPARTSLVTKSIWSSKTRSYCLPPLRPARAPVFMLALAICSASHVACSAHGVDSSASSSSGLSCAHDAEAPDCGHHYAAACGTRLKGGSQRQVVPDSEGWDSALTGLRGVNSTPQASGVQAA